MTGRFPDVIGIGTRRCGSSWLHAVLNSHPEIGKPASGLHYFSQHYNRGPDWYAEQFAPYADRRLLLEFSVSYLYPENCGVAAERMRKGAPDARLFLCVRNPVARAYSDYLRSVRMNEIPASVGFLEAVALHPTLLDRGRYKRLLEPFLQRYSRNAIKILFYDDLDAAPTAFAAELADFLGVPPSFNPEAVSRAEPKGKTVRSQWLNRMVRGVKDASDAMASRLGQADRWSNWKGRHLLVYERALDLTHRKQQLNRDVASRLVEEFREDVDFLERLTGRDLKGWRNA